MAVSPSTASAAMDRQFSDSSVSLSAPEPPPAQAPPRISAAMNKRFPKSGARQCNLSAPPSVKPSLKPYSWANVDPDSFISAATNKQSPRPGINLDCTPAPPPPIPYPEQQQLADAVNSAVSRIYSRMEQHFQAQKAELEAKEKAAEKALKARIKKEKKEREEERKELVEMIREMALELEDRESEVEEPIVLKDAVGRKFIFPFEACRTWNGFSDLVKQAFQHVDVIGTHVNDGYYDILSPKRHIILPSLWDDVIEPGWEVSMHMWPMPDTWAQQRGPPPPSPPPMVEIIEDWGNESGRKGKSKNKAHKGRRLDDSFEEEKPTHTPHKPHHLVHIFEDESAPLNESGPISAPLEASGITSKGQENVVKVEEEEPQLAVAAEEDQPAEWEFLED